MAQTIYDVLDDLRETAVSEADKGSRLERLIANYLRTDPVYSAQFADVWLWQDWPGREGKRDTGIDLVARDRVSGGLTAIQCKFFSPSSTISKPDIDTFLSASGKEGFTERIIVSTTDKWNPNAEHALQGQQIPVRRIGVAELAASAVDWANFSLLAPDTMEPQGRKTLLPHQTRAYEAVIDGFTKHDRGKLIMACGTGKTFTSLRLMEELVRPGETALFLVPSISLLSQSLREWMSERETDIVPVAVCSDKKSTARAASENEDISAVDLALPATTNSQVLARRLEEAFGQNARTVIFSTYQSIDSVARALELSPNCNVTLTICDEAHRTTGVTLADDPRESAFVKIHNDDFIKSAKRLYMTATPRIYDDASKSKAGQVNAVIASMDDETLFGPEFHRLGFGEAVAEDLLTDYKVLVLAVDETSVAQTFQVQLAEDGELRLDDAAKIVGCWNGLAKKGKSEHPFALDPAPMQRAVAFAGSIKDSKKIEKLFNSVVGAHTQAINEESDIAPGLKCEVRHVDGSFNALERDAQLQWLKSPIAEGECRVLTNARCLSEGVDVPALDAVMFLSPRKSKVDIVQSVGRVMRKSSEKRYGYIILPIGIPFGVAPEAALRDNTRYAAVWDVLQALRAHDERFDAMINRIDLRKDRDEKVNVIGVGRGAGSSEEQTERNVQEALALSFLNLDDWREAIYARLVEKVGSQKYWEDWAKDIADIARRHTTRINALLDMNERAVSSEFDRFLYGLRGNLNEGISRSDAVDMLAQHLITRPVFDALFGGFNFSESNPVAQSMERMLTVLDEHSLDNEHQSLEKFYDSVRMRAQGVNTAFGRQKLIVQLYDTFFSTAFKKTVDRLGVVYTPVEIVDFIIQSAEDVLRLHFAEGLTAEGVHVLDGFTGTGTFIVRCLQSGLITPHDLARKYANELHANELLLLAYYIAAVNIESAYQDLVHGSVDSSQTPAPFPGLILTDTFQSYEDDDRPDLDVFPENNERLEYLKALPITVILGNPPYSVGQDSGNDDNRNTRYAALDAAIESTYAEKSKAASKRTLYDAYIRAIKWATLRIGERGVVGFVTNNGFLTSNSADGIRLSLAEEFSSIYIFNLRGNRRNAGAEGRPIFEAFAKGSGGSIAGIAVVILVKDATHVGPARIHYAQVADYMSAHEKVDQLVETKSILRADLREITPNFYGDWLDQRSEQFLTFPVVATKEKLPRFFDKWSLGLATGRDAWAYNFSSGRLLANAEEMLSNYNNEVAQTLANPSYKPTRDKTRISWNANLDEDFSRRRTHSYSSKYRRVAQYRPFNKQHVYFDRSLTARTYQLPSLFPTRDHPNIGFSLTGPGSHYEFSVIATDVLPDLHLVDTGQFFARYRYESVEETLASEASEDITAGFRRVDNINDRMYLRFCSAYGPSITRDEIFAYMYAVLHAPAYRASYGADLRKMLPRIPLHDEFGAFATAGQRLIDLHTGYENAEVFPLEEVGKSQTGDGYEFYRVRKMAFTKRRTDGKALTDRGRLVYNSNVTLEGVPEEAFEYRVGPRSALEWVVDRYQVRTDKASGIMNDPNDWSFEHREPRYILDLVGRVITVSLSTLEIVRNLPAVDFSYSAY